MGNLKKRLLGEEMGLPIQTQMFGMTLMMRWTRCTLLSPYLLQTNQMKLANGNKIMDYVASYPPIEQYHGFSPFLGITGLLAVTVAMFYNFVLIG